MPARVQSGFICRDEDYGYSEHHSHILIKADLVTASIECPTCHQQRPMVSDTHPQGTSQLPGGKLITLDPPDHGVTNDLSP